MPIIQNHQDPNVRSPCDSSLQLNHRLTFTPATDWNSPFSFVNPVYRVEDEAGNVQRTITGTVSQLLAM